MGSAESDEYLWISILLFFNFQLDSEQDMTKTFFIKILAITLTATILLFGFQNCGSSIDSISISSNTDTFVDFNNPPDTTEPSEPDPAQPIDTQPDTPIPLSACNEARLNTNDQLQLSLIEPQGYQKREVSWEVAFSHPANPKHYPDTYNAAYPVGSWTLSPKDANMNVIQHIPIKAKYISVPFIADGPTDPRYPDIRHKLEWIGAVSIMQLPTYRPHPATINYVTISPCAGDFRTTDQFAAPSNDQTLTIKCRVIGRGSGGGQIYFGTHSSGCQLTPGKRYYINIVFADPNNGLDPTESTCSTTSGYIQDGQGARGVCDSEFWMRN